MGTISDTIASISPMSMPNSNVGVAEIANNEPFLNECSTILRSDGKSPALCTLIRIPCLDK